MLALRQRQPLAALQPKGAKELASFSDWAPWPASGGGSAPSREARWSARGRWHAALPPESRASASCASRARSTGTPEEAPPEPVDTPPVSSISGQREREFGLENVGPRLAIWAGQRSRDVRAHNWPVNWVASRLAVRLVELAAGCSFMLHLGASLGPTFGQRAVGSLWQLASRRWPMKSVREISADRFGPRLFWCACARAAR